MKILLLLVFMLLFATFCRKSDNVPPRHYNATLLGPTLSSLSPATSVVTMIPSKIIATFNEAMTIPDTDAFILSGSCDVLPRIDPTITHDDTAKRLTIILDGGSCSDGQSLTLALDYQQFASATGSKAQYFAGTATYTYDVPPTLISLTPSPGKLSKIPSVGYASFSKAMSALSPAAFSLTGTCTTLPIISSVTMSDDKKVASALLVNGLCSDAQVLTLSVDPSLATDSALTPGAGVPQSASYTLSLLGPSIGLAPPSKTYLNASASTSLALTFNAPTGIEVSTTGTLTAAGQGVTMSVTSGNPSCTIEVSTISTKGATVGVSSCSGNGTFTLHIEAGILRDTLGKESVKSSESSLITVDNTPPTITSSFSPSTSYVGAMPSSVALTFSEAVTALNSANFVVSGSCVTNPTITVAMNSSNTTATATLANGLCINGETLTLTLDPRLVSDLSGNKASGTALTATYTLDSTVPTLASSVPTNGASLGGIPSSIVLTFSEAVVASAANFSVNTGTCSVAPRLVSVSGSGTSTITVTLSGGSCASGQTVVLTAAMGGISNFAGTTGSGNASVSLTYTSYMIFVSSTTYSGNLGGVSGADAKCMADSNKPNSSTYKAMLIDGASRQACNNGCANHSDWVFHASSAYYRPDGTTLIGTTTSNANFSFPLSNSFSAVSYSVWSGLNSDWSSGTVKCSSFSSNSPSDGGSYGATDATGSTAISSGSGQQACNTALRLLCVEQ